MTIRRRPAPQPRGGNHVSREEFPALAAFFSGYLHEDFVPEHGTAKQAAQAYRADATPAERRDMDEELRRLLARSERWPLSDLRRAITTLGAAWHPAARADVEALLEQDGTG